MQSTIKYGGGSIMAWRCINKEEIGNLHFIEKTKDKYIYCKILEIELTNIIHVQDFKEDNVIFQHNNTILV
jgi:hypothetical protein